MATERKYEASVDECAFEWGTCAAVNDPTQPARHFFHLCGALPNHTGLHYCSDCGVVHIAKTK